MEADVVITTALIPGKREPGLIKEDTVRAMRPDRSYSISRRQGGNCGLRPRETVVEHGAVHAPLTSCRSFAVHASQMLSRNHSAFLQLLIKDGKLTLNFDDEIIREACVTHEGKIVAERIRSIVEAVPA